MADLGVDFFDGMRDSVQMRLDRLWRELLERGQSVIVEDGTWKREERDAMRHVAKAVNAVTEIHCFDVTLDELGGGLTSATLSPFGTVPISRQLLEESVLRFDRPDAAELALFDRSVMHS